MNCVKKFSDADFRIGRTLVVDEMFSYIEFTYLSNQHLNFFIRRFS